MAVGTACRYAQAWLIAQDAVGPSRRHGALPRLVGACLSRQSQLGRFMGDAVGMPEEEKGHVVRRCRVPMPESLILRRGTSLTLSVDSYPTMPL